jgi:hypothetical protein
MVVPMVRAFLESFLCSVWPFLPIPTEEVKPMTGNVQLSPEKVACRICGKQLDPSKPLGSVPSDEDLSCPEGFYCVDCWFRELRTETAESLLARVRDRVLLE